MASWLHHRRVWLEVSRILVVDWLLPLLDQCRRKLFLMHPPWPLLGCGATSPCSPRRYRPSPTRTTRLPLTQKRTHGTHIAYQEPGRTPDAPPPHNPHTYTPTPRHTRNALHTHDGSGKEAFFSIFMGCILEDGESQIQPSTPPVGGVSKEDGMVRQPRGRSKYRTPEDDGEGPKPRSSTRRGPPD